MPIKFSSLVALMAFGSVLWLRGSCVDARDTKQAEKMISKLVSEESEASSSRDMYEGVLRSLSRKIDQSHETYNGEPGSKLMQEEVANLKLALQEFDERLAGLRERIRVLSNEADDNIRAPAEEGGKIGPQSPKDGECILFEPSEFTIKRKGVKSETLNANSGHRITPTVKPSSAGQYGFCVIIAKCKLDPKRPAMITSLMCAGTRDGCPTPNQCLDDEMTNSKIENVVFADVAGKGKVQTEVNPDGKQTLMNGAGNSR